MPPRAEQPKPFVVSEPPPVSGGATDDLRTTPFAHLLVELLVAQRTGTLFIRDANEVPQAAICFESGMPVAAAFERAQSINELSAALIPLCAWVEGRFIFIDGHELESSSAIVAPAPLDPLLLLAAAARGPLREDAVDQAVSVIGRNLLELNPQINLARYAFTGREIAVIECLELGPIDLDELRSLAAVPERVLRRVLYVLRLTGALGLTPPLRRFSGTIAHTPELTELDEPGWSTTQPQLRPSGMSRVRRTPPPRLFRSGAGASGRYSMHEPDHGMTALDVPDVERPSMAPTPTPTPTLDPPPPPPLRQERVARDKPRPEPRDRALQAGALWDRAEAALKRRDHSGALLNARDAMKFGAPSAEQEALFAWALYQNAGAGARIHPKVFEHLDRALRSDPLCERAHYYKGLLLKQKGLPERAHAHFQRVLLLNSGHVDAAREVRIFEMRRVQERQPSGRLRRWLKREPSAK